ncbi:chemotaxis protein CheB [Desulfonema magnum]|uniref:protein-glutamate methylesterase n=1 Tax=Desulfonema magnum TaxID=45655 RepID=A0A975BPI4_9BACT|nr:chemotaxis protein CheB [Desulfonema magnum]QTA89225.1 Two component system response regulator/histidine kinase, CheB domain-containing [Desulfonema magnum]
MTNNKIKVLVVDDTAFMRKAIPQILESDSLIEVADAAKNGLEALYKIRELQPDVITLDIDMPIMDGLTAIKHIMIESPVPIVALSSLFSNGAITFEALRLGVADFVPKPSGAISTDIDKSRQQITDRVKMAFAMNLDNVRRVRLPKKWDVKKRLESLYKFYPLEYIIVIGTTLAGPNTVIRLLSKLSPTVPAAIIVIQEISPKIISSFVEQFNEYVPWNVVVAKNNSALEQGTCYMSSNEDSLTLRLNENGEIRLHSGAKINYPLNCLFSSAAEIFRQNTIGVLLSGIGDDGADGFARIKHESGITIAKDATCCVYPNLTDNAIRQGVVDIILDDNKLASTLEAIVEN